MTVRGYSTAQYIQYMYRLHHAPRVGMLMMGGRGGMFTYCQWPPLQGWGGGSRAAAAGAAAAAGWEQL